MRKIAFNSILPITPLKRLTIIFVPPVGVNNFFSNEGIFFAVWL